MFSWTNYILGTDSCLFHNVAVWDARHNTYYYLVVCCLCGSAPAAYSRYLRKLTCFPISLPVNPDRIYRMFDKLGGVIPMPPWS